MPVPQFRALFYSGDTAPSGEIELTVSPATLALVDALCFGVRAALPAGYRGDCVWETVEWYRQLEGFVRVQRVGGVGIDDAQPGPDYRMVRPSGYREDDGEVHQHWWLLLEDGEHVFDPTVHRQFDGRGGFSPDRYVLDGVARAKRPLSLKGTHLDAK